MIAVSFLGIFVLGGLLCGLVLLALLWNSGPNGRTAAGVLGLMAMVMIVIAAVGWMALAPQQESATATVVYKTAETGRHTASSVDYTRSKSDTATVTAAAGDSELVVSSTDNGSSTELIIAEAPVAAAERVSITHAAPSDSTSVADSIHHEHYPAPVVTVDHTAAVPIILVLLVLAGVVLLIIYLFSSSRVGLALVLMGFCFVFLLLTSMWSYRRVGTSHSIATAAYNSNNALPSPFGTNELPSIQTQLDALGNSQDIWTTEANDTHVSDTFASLENLGRGVAFRVIDRLTQSKTQPKVITVRQQTSGSVGADLTEAVVGCSERLKTAFPEIKVNSVFGSNSPRGGSENAVVSLRVGSRTRRSAPWDVSEMAVEYLVRAELYFDDSQYPFTVNYIEKPWVDDISKYLVNRPNQMLLRARSSSLQESESQARREAYSTAASQIAPQISSFIRSTYPDVRGISSRECKRFVENAIANQNVFVIDRFPQAVEVRGLDLWRESVLLHVDPGGLAYIARTQANAHRVHRNRDVSNSFALACLLVLVVGVCVGVNSMTKGYYKNPLVIFASVAVVGVFLMLLS